jgi:multidrug efflux system outer membrane protein
MMRAALAGTLVAVLLTACMVGPDYRRPNTEAPALYRFAPAQGAPNADTTWWKAFGDPVLDQLIDEALAHNNDVKVAAANVEAASGLLTQVRSPLFPQVNYGAHAGRYRFSKSTTIELPAGVSNPTSYFDVLAGASWEIDLWGRVRRQVQGAQANVLATEEARQGVVLTLITQLATSYVQLRSLDEQLVVAQRTLDAYAGELKITKDKFEFGQVSQMNVAQVQSRYETVAAKIPDIRSQMVVTENAIAVLLGRNPGEVTRGKTLADLAAPPVPEGVPSELLERRPDILQAEEQLVAATAQIGAAKAQYFPSISLTGQYGSGSTELNQLFKGATNTWNYVGTITGPIFRGGAISGQVAEANASQQAALFNYQRVIQNAFADVDDALSSHTQVLEQVAAQERLVKALTEYSQLARLQYDGGYAPYSTVLQAEQQLFPEELTLATLRAQALSSVIGIYRALGGGWVNEAAKRTASLTP